MENYCKSIIFEEILIYQETIAAVIELTDCSITVKGQYVPSNKTPEQVGTDRRLYILIEGIIFKKLYFFQQLLK